MLLRASGLTVSQVAERLDVGYKAAESLVSRGRAAVKASLVAGVASVLAGVRSTRRLSLPATVGVVAVAGFTAAVVTPDPSPAQRPEYPRVAAAAAERTVAERVRVTDAVPLAGAAGETSPPRRVAG